MTFDDFAAWVAAKSRLPRAPSANLAGLVLTEGTMMREAFLLGMQWRAEFSDARDGMAAARLNDTNELEH